MPNFHPYAQAVLATPSLVHYWRLGDRDGSVAVDEAGTQDGSYVGGITLGVPGALKSPNTAVDFDGVDGQVDVAHHASQLLTGGGAIEAWIFPRSSGGGGFGRIVDKASGSVGSEGYSFYVRAGSSVLRLTANIAGGAGRLSADDSIAFNSWHHVIVSWNALGQVTFFVNGQVSGASDQQSGDPAGIVTTDPLFIANWILLGSRHFDGSIDEVSLYSQPFTPAMAARRWELGVEQHPRLMGVTVSGVDRTDLVDGDAGFTWSDQVNGRGQLSLTITDAPGGFRPEDGAEVLVYEDSERRFGGHLYEPEEQLTPERDLIFYTCAAVEFSAIPDRLTVTRIYEGETFEDIVTDIVAQDLAGEGISTSGVDAGPVIERAVFDESSVTDAFNDLAELVGYSWWIDEDRVLHFHARDAILSPAELNHDTVTNGSLRVRADRERYRNRQVLRGGKALTDPRAETSVGDGERRVFATAFPIGAEPTVEVSYSAGAFVEETVGILGVDDAEDWFWNLTESQISQNENNTVLATVDRVRVTYRGQFNLKIEYTDLLQVSERQALEGGTGVHTHVENRPEVESLDQGIQTVFALIERFGKLGKIVTAETREPGLRVGQLIHIDVPEHGLDGDFLIEALTATVPPGMTEIWYQVTARQGDPYGSWQAFFRQLLSVRKPFTLGKEDESLTHLRNVSVPVVADVNVVVDEDAPEDRIGFLLIGRGEVGENP